ncbi:prenyltransferase [Thermococcus sp.]|uniref:prenyltransferase n=1 Tax=Thermococcus sp. TaxID=35749 RepID=UPI0025FCBB7C|nr:prenyltransferase [Thermococcus sp.]
MLIKEVLTSVEVIRDPYIKAVTYAKIGERLARVREGHYKGSFLRAIETTKEIEDPVKTFKALLSIGYSMSKAGIKASKRIYQGVLEDSRALPAPHRDVVMESAAMYMLSLGEIGEAITYALEISSPKLRNEVLLAAMRTNTRKLGKEGIRVAYHLRKSKLALEYIDSEPYHSMGIMELIRAYISLGGYETAITLISQIRDRDWARQAFKEVAFYMKERDVIGHYIDTLEGVVDDLITRFDEDFAAEMAFAFALSGEGLPAIELVRKMKNATDVLLKLVLELLERDHDVLPSLVAVLNEEEATLVGKVVMNRILERPELGSREVVEAIGKSTRNGEVWAKIARYYILMDEVDEAMRTASLLHSERLRSVVMADISHHLLKKGEVERAIDAAIEVRDPDFSSILISEILLKALERELDGKVVPWNGSKH